MKMSNQKHIVSILIITIAVIAVLAVGVSVLMVRYAQNISITNNNAIAYLKYPYKITPPIIIKLPDEWKYQSGEYYKNVTYHNWVPEKNIENWSRTTIPYYVLGIGNREYNSEKDIREQFDLESTLESTFPPLAQPSIKSFQKYKYKARYLEFLITEYIETNTPEKIVNLSALYLLPNGDTFAISTNAKVVDQDKSKKTFFGVLDTVQLR